MVVALLSTACATNSASHIPQQPSVSVAASSGDTARVISAQLPTELDATNLVTTFASRDAIGERLKSAAWFDSIAVGGQPLRRDSLQLIANFRIGASAVGADTAHVLVNYQVMGTIDRVRDSLSRASTRYTSTPGNQFGEFVLARTNAGWRVVQAPRTMRVFASTFLNDPTLPQLPDTIRTRVVRELGTAR